MLIWEVEAMRQIGFLSGINISIYDQSYGIVGAQLVYKLL